MIISFGAILMYFGIASDQYPPNGDYHGASRKASSYETGIAGKAALQALAAANAGAKVALVSKIGDDHYGKNALLKLRQRGVITSGVGRNNTVSTGTCFEISGKSTDRIVALGASQWVDNEQAPDEILKPGIIVMVQTEIGIKETSTLLARAKEQDCTTILNLSPNTDLSEEDLKNTDYLVVPEPLKGHVADARKYQDLTLIVLSTNGDAVVTKAGEMIVHHEKPQDENLNWLHLAASEDAFVGTLAAGLYAKHSIVKASKTANIARTLTASKKGSHVSMPYKDEIQALA